jgi:hypothetical protein
VEFDASLSGAGLLWYKRESDGFEVCLGGGAVHLRGLDLGVTLPIKTQQNSLVLFWVYGECHGWVLWTWRFRCEGTIRQH